MKLKDWFFLVLLSVIWGSAFMFTKVALRQLTPFMIVFGRLLLASIVLLVVCKIRKLKFPESRKTLFSMGFLGVINTVTPFLVIAWSQKFIDTATASILNATSPIFVMILAQFFTEDEKMTTNKAIGVLLGVAGIFVMVSPAINRSFDITNFGPFGMLCGTFFYAMAGIYAKRFKEYPSMVVAAISLLGGVIFMLPAFIIVDLPVISQLGLKTILAVSFLGLVCTSIAYLLYFSLISSSGATNALLVTLLIPVSAFVFGVTIMDEVVKPENIKGMILIGSGLLVIDGRFIRLPGPQRLFIRR
ncbi:MAG: DMT family transporter [Candidatus Rifleibacteriota bacterium]